MDIGFNEVASAVIGFLFGLLVSWTTKLHNPPESELIRDMLDNLRKAKKKPSWPPPPRHEQQTEMIQKMLEYLLKKEKQLNGKKGKNENE